MNTNVKWLIVIAAVVAAVMLYRRRMSAVSAGTPEGYRSSVEAEKEDLSKYNAIRTYTDDQYKAFADQLETAMRGMGTNDGTVYDIMESMRTTADVEALVAAFGVKKKGLKGRKLGLGGWLKDDLSRKELAKINTTLRNNDIAYSFYDKGCRPVWLCKTF